VPTVHHPDGAHEGDVVVEEKQKILIIGNPDQAALKAIRTLASEKGVEVVIACESDIVAKKTFELTSVEISKLVEADRIPKYNERKHPYRDAKHKGRWRFPNGS
jgi:hypothetical protein